MCVCVCVCVCACVHACGDFKKMICWKNAAEKYKLTFFPPSLPPPPPSLSCFLFCSEMAKDEYTMTLHYEEEREDDVGHSHKAVHVEKIEFLSNEGGELAGEGDNRTEAVDEEEYTASLNGDDGHQLVEEGRGFNEEVEVVINMDESGTVARNDGAQAVKGVACHLCDKVFQTRSYLKVHIQGTHYGLKPHVCKDCGKAFSRSSLLSEHRRIHNDNLSFECDICQRRFRWKSSLNLHKQTHNEDRPHACPICPQTFRWRITLRRHMTEHNESAAHTCDVCGKSFRDAYGARQHKRVHTRERPFSCLVCKRTFRWKHQVTSHACSGPVDGDEPPSKDDSTCTDQTLVTADSASTSLPPNPTTSSEASLNQPARAAESVAESTRSSHVGVSCSPLTSAHSSAHVSTSSVPKTSACDADASVQTGSTHVSAPAEFAAQNSEVQVAVPLSARHASSAAALQYDMARIPREHLRAAIVAAAIRQEAMAGRHPLSVNGESMMTVVDPSSGMLLTASPRALQTLGSVPRHVLVSGSAAIANNRHGAPAAMVQSRLESAPANCQLLDRPNQECPTTANQQWPSRMQRRRTSVDIDHSYSKLPGDCVLPVLQPPSRAQPVNTRNPTPSSQLTTLRRNMSDGAALPHVTILPMKRNGQSKHRAASKQPRLTRREPIDAGDNLSDDQPLFSSVVEVSEERTSPLVVAHPSASKALPQTFISEQASVHLSNGREPSVAYAFGQGVPLSEKEASPVILSSHKAPTVQPGRPLMF